jgi:hypothetical protein
MADYNSSLPIRTENDGDAVVKIADATIPSQQLTVEADGSINVNAAFSPGSEVIITDGTDTLEINADGSINSVVTATDLDIRDLVFATDKVDVSGSSVTVTATDLDIRDIDATQDNIAISDGTDTLAVNADGSINSVVTATDLDIRDLSHTQDSVRIGDGTDLLAVNTDGSLNVVVVSEQDGTEVVNYQTSASVASSASVNHDYTVSGGVTFYGEEAWISASGKIKVQLLVNAAVKFVGFSSTANPNIRIPLEHLVKAAATQVVRITITNLDNQAQDVYSTLVGVEK